MEKHLANLSFQATHTLDARTMLSHEMGESCDTQHRYSSLHKPHFSGNYTSNEI
jgi:hypothetical protein